MSEEAGGVMPAGHRDRTVGLVLFGVGFLACGAFLAFMAVFMAIALAMPQPAGGPVLPKWMLVALPACYLLFAAVLATMGIGCCLRCRWARALALILGWLWLGMGVLEFVMLPLVLLGGVAGTDPVMPLGALVTVMMIGVVGVFIVPGLALVLFFRSPHVKATCEARHPAPSWTDRCPLPVLALALMQAVGGLSMLACAPFFPVPWFNSVVTGPLAMFLMAAFASAWLALAWQNYRLRVAGWWGTVALMIVGAAWGAVIMGGGGLAAYYEAMGLTDPATLAVQESFTGPFVVGVQVSSLGLWLGYLLWIRRSYPAFRREATA